MSQDGADGIGRSRMQHEFVAEAEEILERLGGDLEDLADRRVKGQEPSPDLVNRLFRSAHTLKGLASSVGLDALGELSHAMEDVLDGLRLGRLALESPAVALLGEALAMLVLLLREMSEPGGDEDAPPAVHELCARIHAALETSGRPGAAPDALRALALDASVLAALTEYEEHRLRENLRLGRTIVRVEASFGLEDFEQGLATMKAGLGDVGELISTLPAAGDDLDTGIRFVLLVASTVDDAELATMLDVEPGQVVRVGGGPAVETVPLIVRAPQDETESLRSISDTVRVDIRKLDELMNLIGELLIHKGQVSDLATRLLGDPASVRVGSELSKIHKRLDRKLQQLQSSALELRMVPLQHVFEKLSRAARRLERDLGKQVTLDLVGAETELDKLIVEELVDPLLHLVRNSFDHAIEPAAERIAAGKPAEGTVRIAASQRGNHVVIEVSDDGRGIDPERLRARAEASGLLAPGEAIAGRELLDLVFMPGLSTRSEVTETSGRGVGMDIVRANVTALGGRVDLDSRFGRGMRVTLTLPITLAIIQTLIVGVGDQLFAIPLTAVLETLRVERSDIQFSEDREVLNLRGEPLVVRDLAREFDLPARADSERCFAVVLGLGDARVGILVDRLEGQQDAVVKPIQGPIAAVRGVTGATELGSRGAVLVIDVAALVEKQPRHREAA